MSDRQRALRSAMLGAGWALLNALSSRLINLLILWLAAQSLSAADYGLLALMQTSAQAWSLLLGAGVSFTLSRYVASYKANRPQKLKGFLATILLFSVVVIVILAGAIVGNSERVSTWMFDGALGAGQIQVLALWILVWTLNTCLIGALTGFEAFRYNTIVSLIGGITSLAIVVSGNGASVSWVMGALIAGQGVILLGCSINMRRLLNGLSSIDGNLIDARHIGVLLRFGLPSFIGGILLTQTQWYANVHLARSGQGLEKMAVMGIALQWYAVVQFVPGVVSNSMLPILTRYLGVPAIRKILFRQVLLFNLFLACAVSGGTVMLARMILESYGAGYVASVDAFSLIAIAGGVAACCGLFMQDIASRGSTLTILVFNGVWCVAFWLTLRGQGGGWQLPENLCTSYLVAASVQLLVIILYSRLFKMENAAHPAVGTVSPVR